MRTWNINWKTLTLGLLLFLGVGSAMAKTWRFELKNDKRDFGSGTAALNLYYPGGESGWGPLAGHANHLTRKDRILLRFDLTDLYLLKKIPEIRKVYLEFSLSCVEGGKRAERRVEAWHLNYETQTFLYDDLICDEATLVGTEPLPPAGEPDDRAYRFDVTDMVKEDVKQFRHWAAFRLADSCETEENTTGKPVGYHIQTSQTGKIVPVLVVETE